MNGGCFPPSVVPGFPLSACTKRVLWEGWRAPWFTCLRRCAVDFPRSRACLPHQGYCLRSFIVFSRGIPANRPTHHESAKSPFFVMRLGSLTTSHFVSPSPDTPPWHY